jgi:altronate hydrolase
LTGRHENTPRMNDPNPFLRLHPSDNVVVARLSVPTGVAHDGVTATQTIEMAHKMAVAPIRSGEPVLKFGQPIGFASTDIQPGEWVHTHNVGLGELRRDYEIGTALIDPPRPAKQRTFMGYRRPDGRAATRNYIGIVSTVNCSATSSKYIADAFDSSILADFPNVDGVIALTHKGGCAFEYGGADHALFNRTLAGFARHPNIAAYLIVGLGCEVAQASLLAEEHQLVSLEGVRGQEKWGQGSGDRAQILPPVPSSNPPPVPYLNIQEQGGVAKTVRRGVELLQELLPQVNDIQREPIPVSELILATECGGSDGNSGVTANPALGHASDLLVAHGGTSILGETPEIYGGEHLLLRRAVSPEVAEKLLARIRWWEDYARRFDSTIDNNPSYGNKQGGLTTIYEKSLGAIAKGGSSPLRAVYEYAEPVTEKGFVFMDTPGYDPPSVTGMVAGGAQVVVFTTGRGSCYGCKPAPTIKLATNTPMYQWMIDDMDLNAGGILDGAETVESVGETLFEKILAVASGEQTKSEAQGIGDEEFCPWMPGASF